MSICRRRIWLQDTTELELNDDMIVTDPHTNEKYPVVSLIYQTTRVACLALLLFAMWNSSPSIYAQTTVPLITIQPATQNLERGQNVNFSVTVTGAAPLTYAWWKDSAALAQGTSSNLVVTNLQG